MESGESDQKYDAPVLSSTFLTERAERRVGSEKICARTGSTTTDVVR